MIVGWQVLSDKLAAVIWSHCQPTLPKIRILFGHDALTPSYLRVLPIEEGSVDKKSWRWQGLEVPIDNEFHSVTICVETMGVWGPNGANSLKKLESNTK